MTALAQTVQAPSPKQGRPGEILPWTRFRPRTESYIPTAEEKQQIQSKIDQLGAMIRAIHADDSLLVDVEIFHQAARWIMTFPEEFFRKEVTMRPACPAAWPATMNFARCGRRAVKVRRHDPL